MKKLFLGLVVISTMFSCGKKNSTVATGTNVVSNSYSSVNTDSRFTSLSSLVTSNSGFTTDPRISYFTEFQYFDVKNNCTTKDGWWIFDYTTCSASYTNKTVVLYGSVTVAQKQAELVALLNKTVSVSQNGSLYIIRTVDNISYYLDTRFPIQANPVYRYEHSTGKANTLGQVQY